MLKLGDTFTLPTTKNPIEHLWIVITERDPKTHEAVCVNITTTKEWTTKADKTLELKPGVHEFVNFPSIVYYKDTRVLYLDKVEEMLITEKNKVVCRQYEPCSEELLALIRAGMPHSGAVNKMKERCRKEWETAGLIPPTTG